MNGFFKSSLFVGAILSTSISVGNTAVESKYNYKATFVNSSNETIDFALTISQDRNANPISYWDKYDADIIGNGTGIAAFGKNSHDELIVNYNVQDAATYMLPGEMSEQQVLHSIKNCVIGDESDKCGKEDILLGFNVWIPGEGVKGLSFWSDDIFTSIGGPYTISYVHQPGESPKLVIKGKSIDRAFNLEEGENNDVLNRAISYYNKGKPIPVNIDGVSSDGDNLQQGISNTISSNIAGVTNDLSTLGAQIEYTNLQLNHPELHKELEEEYYKATGERVDDDYSGALLQSGNEQDSTTDMGFNELRDNITEALKEVYGQEAKDFKIYHKDLVYEDTIKSVSVGEAVSEPIIPLIAVGKARNESPVNQTMTVGGDSVSQTETHSFAQTKSWKYAVSRNISFTAKTPVTESGVSTGFEFAYTDESTNGESHSKTIENSLPSQNITVPGNSQYLNCSFLELVKAKGAFNIYSKISGPVSIAFRELSSIGIQKYKKFGDDPSVLWRKEDYVTIAPQMLQFNDISDLVKFVNSKNVKIKGLSLLEDGQAYLEGTGEYQGFSQVGQRTTENYLVSAYDMRDARELCKIKKSESESRALDFELKKSNKMGSLFSIQLLITPVDEGVNRVPVTINVTDSALRNCKVKTLQNDQWKEQGYGNKEVSFIPDDYTKPVISYDCEGMLDVSGNVNFEVTRGMNKKSKSIELDYVSSDDIFGLISNLGDKYTAEYRFDRTNLPNGKPKEIHIEFDDKMNREGDVRVNTNGKWVELGDTKGITFIPSQAAWEGKESFGTYRVLKNSESGNVVATVMNGSFSKKQTNKLA